MAGLPLEMAKAAAKATAGKKAPAKAAPMAPTKARAPRKAAGATASGAN